MRTRMLFSTIVVLVVLLFTARTQSFGGKPFGSVQNAVVVLHHFDLANDGAFPYGQLVVDKRGNIYGTTSELGAYDSGTLFEIDPQGHFMCLHAFGPLHAGPSSRNYNTEGACPHMGLSLDAQGGSLYGATPEGGREGAGTIFCFSLKDRAYSCLYSFQPFAACEGHNALLHPQAVVSYGAGRLIGCTQLGGEQGGGMIFSLDRSGRFRLLHSFPLPLEGAESAEGAYPDFLWRAPDGSLYGTTLMGGRYGGGIVFKLDVRSGSLKVLHAFHRVDALQRNQGGAYPYGLLCIGSELYGTTYAGGVYGGGVLYMLELAAGRLHVLHNFGGKIADTRDGAYPNGTLVMDSQGDLYGTTVYGGANDIGTVFMWQRKAHRVRLVHSFGSRQPDGTNSDGAFPRAGLVRDAKGNLYGTTSEGGAYNLGLVFEISLPDNRFRVVHYFSGSSKGYEPLGGVVALSNGTLYGTTAQGGTYREGVLYSLDKQKRYRVLASFNRDSVGANPKTPLVFDGRRSLYGITALGGEQDAGTLFQATLLGSVRVLYSFSAYETNEGEERTGIVMDRQGRIYGATAGANVWNIHGNGEIFRYEKPGKLVPIYTFVRPQQEGAHPIALVVGSAGLLYSVTTSGGLFGNGTLISIDAKGHCSVLHTFTRKDLQGTNLDGAEPTALTIDSKGNLYGVTAGGGSYGAGTLFMYSPSTHEFKVLHAFSAPTQRGQNGRSTEVNVDGSAPCALVVDGDSNLFGIASRGGANGTGTLFELSRDGMFRVLFHFPALDDYKKNAYGAYPASLTISQNNRLYGTTRQGGCYGGGTLFSLSLDDIMR
jgi:uncharacterized repeat protein (TIGR03803 family)